MSCVAWSHMIQKNTAHDRQALSARAMLTPGGLWLMRLLSLIDV